MIFPSLVSFQRASVIRTFSLLAFLVILLAGHIGSAGVLLSSLMGTCFDEEGKPMAGAVLRFTDPANGRHFEVRSNVEGRFSYIAVEPSRYRLDVLRDRKPQASFASVDLQWSSHPLLMEISLQHNSVRVTRQVLLAEAFQTESPPFALTSPPNTDEAIVRAINQQLAAARAYMDAENWENARAAAKAATEIDPKRDLPWAWLANVYCAEASRTTAPAGSLLQNCIQNYKYAIAIAPNATYYNNLGTAYCSMKHWKEAAENFSAAEQLNPDHGLYHQNLGAALLKQAEALPNGDTRETLKLAADAFSRAAAATPPIPEAYYWKGLCQLRLAALDAPGASYKLADESLQHYLQLAPGGHYASEARTMVEGLKDLAVAENVNP
jgi:tetratricopeptide (TPR) repeat protein